MFLRVCRTTGHDTGGLDQHRIADRDRGRGDADELVEEEIPWFDRHQYAYRVVLHPGVTGPRLVRNRLKHVPGMFGIIGGDAGAQLHLALPLGDQLAHFDCHGRGDLVGVLVQQASQLAQHAKTAVHVAAPVRVARNAASAADSACSTCSAV